jgi:hypothetical protein
MSVFVSHDGDGTEVYVATAKGKVTKLEEKANAVNATIEATYLDWPISGWLNKDEAILEVIRKAYEDGTEIEVRIESQRKKGISRETPINELRKENANKNIIKKLVAVNGSFTGEALTNPADDPATGQATSALTSPRPRTEGASSTGGATVDKSAVLTTLRTLATSREVSEAVIDAVKAQALIAGATPIEVAEAATIPGEQPTAVQSAFSKEAPPFKDYNSDGRTNLGNATVASGINTYNYVYEKIQKQSKAEPNADTVEFFTLLVLAIADRIQVGAYGTGFRVDRSAGSHTRARSSVFTIIDSGVDIPLSSSGTPGDKEAVNQFVQVVGKAARHNLLSGIKASMQQVTVGSLLESLDKSEASTEVNSGIVSAAPVVIDNTESVAPSSVPEPSYSEPEVEPEPTYEAEEPAAAPETAPESSVVVSDGTEWFPQDLLQPGAINSSNAPTEDLLDEFRSFIIEEVGLQTKAEQAQVAKLLSHTFGKSYSKASNIPDDKLGDFLDFYVASGKANFKAVLSSL